jgi:hypothetical protein
MPFSAAGPAPRRTPQSRDQVRRAQAVAAAHKEKSVALLLALLLGPVTYLYSWRHDRRMFRAGYIFSGLAIYALVWRGNAWPAAVVYVFIVLSVLLRQKVWYSNWGRDRARGEWLDDRRGDP